MIGLEELQFSFTRQALVDVDKEVAASLQVYFVVEMEFQSESTIGEEFVERLDFGCLC